MNSVNIFTLKRALALFIFLSFINFCIAYKKQKSNNQIRLKEFWVCVILVILIKSLRGGG